MFVLPKLPYAFDALEPVISARTLHFHHDQHHGGYVRAVNAMVADAGWEAQSLETVIAMAAEAGDKPLFNNAAQARNHSFFWAAMSGKREEPEGQLANAINREFGGTTALKAAFVAAGVAQFGSGWVWLVSDAAGALAITTSHDADDWLGEAGATPLLVCDVWEHAYYLDHQNDRKAFLEAWFDALPNWWFAGAQYAAAKGHGEKWLSPAAVVGT